MLIRKCITPAKKKKLFSGPSPDISVVSCWPIWYRTDVFVGGTIPKVVGVHKITKVLLLVSVFIDASGAFDI